MKHMKNKQKNISATHGAAALLLAAAFTPSSSFAMDAASLNEALKTGGLHALAFFVDSGNVGNVDETIASIPSDKSQARMFGEAAENAARNREFGGSLMTAVVEASARENASLQKVADLLSIRSWLTQKTGYGNLIINYAIEDAVCKSLFRLMPSPDCDTNAMESLMLRISAESPSSSYWLEMLRSEGEELVVENLYPDKKEDCFRLGEIIRALHKKEAAADGLRSGEEDTSGSDYSECFEKYMPAQAGWLLVRTAMYKNALEAMCEVRKNTSAIPAEQDEFEIALKKFADASMKNRDRLGGKIDAPAVWNIWRETAASAE